MLNQIPKIIYNKLVDHDIEDLHLNFGNINAYIYRFNSNVAKKDLEWALEYWEEKREAQITTNKNKCRNCEYYDSFKISKIINI